MHNSELNDSRFKIHDNISTDTFFATYATNYKKFDCIFIDACHEYTQARIDFINSFKILEDDGIIFLHDTYPPSLSYTDQNACGDAYKLYLELTQSEYRDKIDIINLPTWAGLTIIRKLSSKNLLTL
jgi:predicted O-methyltransferase YrrM